MQCAIHNRTKTCPANAGEESCQSDNQENHGSDTLKGGGEEAGEEEVIKFN